MQMSFDGFLKFICVQEHGSTVFFHLKLKIKQCSILRCSSKTKEKQKEKDGLEITFWPKDTVCSVMFTA